MVQAAAVAASEFEPQRTIAGYLESRVALVFPRAGAASGGATKDTVPPPPPTGDSAVSAVKHTMTVSAADEQP